MELNHRDPEAENKRRISFAELEDRPALRGSAGG